MLPNTVELYKHAQVFQNKRARIIAEYERYMKSIETAKGSAYYDDHSTTARTKRDDELKALRSEYSNRLFTIIDDMKRNNNDLSRRVISAPTSEQLRIVQALKLIDKPTKSDIISAANAVADNALCMGIVQELASVNGVSRSMLPSAKEMDSSVVNDYIVSLKDQLRDFLQYDTSRAARVVQDSNRMTYGDSIEDASLPKRKTFEDRDEFYDMFVGLGGDSLKAFCEAVD